MEAALLSHPEVVECAVIGIADEERGQIVEAHIVVDHDVVPDTECIAGCKTTSSKP